MSCWPPTFPPSSSSVSATPPPTSSLSTSRPPSPWTWPWCWSPPHFSSGESFLSWSILYDVLTLFPPVWWRSCPPHPTSGWLISGWSMVSWFRSWRSSYSPSWNWREREPPLLITTASRGWLKLFFICCTNWLDLTMAITKFFPETSVRVALRKPSLRLQKLTSWWDVWRSPKQSFSRSVSSSFLSFTGPMQLLYTSAEVIFNVQQACQKFTPYISILQTLAWTYHCPVDRRLSILDIRMSRPR